MNEWKIRIMKMLWFFVYKTKKRNPFNSLSLINVFVYLNINDYMVKKKKRNVVQVLDS